MMLFHYEYIYIRAGCFCVIIFINFFSTTKINLIFALMDFLADEGREVSDVECLEMFSYSLLFFYSFN